MMIMQRGATAATAARCRHEQGEQMITADRAEITVMVENWVDMLLPDIAADQRDHGDSDGEDAHGHAGHRHDHLHCVSRAGLIHHFDPKRIPPQAENGISLLVKVWRGRSSATVLFDVGLTGSVLAHNFRALDEDPALIDHVVISHGHPDHYGGIHELLGMVDRQVPVATHPHAFLPRYAVMGDGRVAPFYNMAFNEGTLDDEGGRLVLSREPLELGWGLRTTGQIPREVPFEGPRPAPSPGAPGLYQVDADGGFVTDEVWDEQGLVIDVAGEGLVVLTGCAHAGAVNTIHRAREICGDKPIRAVLGGFHLGFPTTPAENVELTKDAMIDLDVKLIMPMHCSGLRAHAAFSQAAPERYVQPSVGTVLRFGR
jgi:7,8-dihydropterin-6-yl-methyl-4-(beta-D-ribofuranosyl)aminobenzene 5'-phosphate synthase